MLRWLNHYISLRRLLMFLAESLVGFLCLQAILWSLHGEASSSAYLYIAAWPLLSVAVYELFIFLFDLYGYPKVHRNNDCMRRLAISFSVATLILFPFYLFATPSIFHLEILLSGSVLMGAVVGVRWALPTLLERTKRLRHTILILGADATATALAQEILANEGSGIDVAGVLALDAPSRSASSSPNRDYQEDMETLVRRERVDTIIISMGERRGRLPLSTLLRLKLQGVSVVDAISFYERYKGQVPIVGPWVRWMVFSDGFKKSAVTHAVKRLLDAALSLLALVVLFPLFVVIAALIKLNSAGPVFFTQERVGLGGKLFRVYKFRSMYTDADPNRLAVNGDSRITPVGRVLRRLRLDELPQLFNVLRGEMSLVGPRPELLPIAQELEKEIPYYFLRQSVKPGITGWAQIRYGYCTTLAEMQEKFKYDLYYVKNLSLLLDFLIMLATIKVLIMGKNVR